MPSPARTRRTLTLIAVFAAVELAAAGILYAYTRLEVNKERSETILGNMTAARFLALAPVEYEHSFSQALFDTGYASLQAFIQGEGGAEPRIGLESGTYHTLHVKRREDMPRVLSPEVASVLNGSRGVAVEETASHVGVIVPLMRAGDEKPYGVLRIETETGDLVEEIVRKNAALYLLVLLLINGQAIAIVVLVTRRPAPVVYERGYLREHAVGALKVQHKILGDIIADHDHLPPSPDEDSGEQPESQVIPMRKSDSPS